MAMPQPRAIDRSERRLRHHAFSLVEILAALAVIGILSSLILVILGGARERANDVKCASNLRQVYALLNLYAGEHDGNWPTPLSRGFNPTRFLPVRWYLNGKDHYGSSQKRHALDPYVDDISVAICPTVEEREMFQSATRGYWYGLSGYQPQPYKMGRVDDGDPYPSLVWCTWPHYAGMQAYGGAPHGGGDCINVLYYDGSVQSVPHDEWRSTGYP